MSTADPEQVRRTAEAVWRIESARILGGLVRWVRDVALAEDVAQDALVAALEHWTRAGIPENPGAWLALTARRRALDRLRRRTHLEARHDSLDALEEHTTLARLERDDGVPDDVLRLMLVACHPVLTPPARAALTLRLVAGLTTEEIARAYLAPEATIAQRIVRAKRTLEAARVAFETPEGDALRERVASVLEVLYLIFNEGYAASAGESWTRAELCEEALRLGRILAELVPREAEVHGLVALMELQASRLRARLDAAGRPVTLLEQDRGRWDTLLIGRGLRALRRSDAVGASRGPYALSAAIAAEHARARRPEQTDWGAIVALYDALLALTGSPIVALNRAVAVSMDSGPAEALALVDALAEEPVLRDYHHVPSVRGDLLLKLGRVDEARAELERAARLTGNGAERALLLARAAACVPPLVRSPPHA